MVFPDPRGLGGGNTSHGTRRDAVIATGFGVRVGGLKAKPLNRRWGGGSETTIATQCGKSTTRASIEVNKTLVIPSPLAHPPCLPAINKTWLLTIPAGIPYHLAAAAGLLCHTSAGLNDFIPRPSVQPS